MSASSVVESFSSFDGVDFENACKELIEPNTDGYEFFTEALGVKIFRLYNEVYRNTEW